MKLEFAKMIFDQLPPIEYDKESTILIKVKYLFIFSIKSKLLEYQRKDY
jgi:hypothetical protein